MGTITLLQCGGSTPFYRGAQSAVRSVGLCFVVLALVCISFAGSGAIAQEHLPVLIAAGTQSAMTAEPDGSARGLPVTVNTPVLERARVGDSFAVELAAGTLSPVKIDQISTLINGDRSYRATGLYRGYPLSLVLTRGASTLYGHLNSREGTFQLATLPTDGGFSGWLYRPQRQGVLSEDNLQNDFLLLPRNKPRNAGYPVIYRQPLDLSAGAGAVTGEIAASQSGINDGNLSIRQHFSRPAIRVNESVDVLLDIKNISSQWHTGLVVDVYFALEDSDLLTADNNCMETYSASVQPVLRCTLGNIEPGQSVSVAYTLRATEASRPYILNTAIVGDLRSDGFINVVDDVRSDNDNDGISDFNETLLGTDPLDPGSVDYRNVIIDVMAFYTPGADALYDGAAETRINQLISVANQIYADSNIGITLRPVYFGQVNYNDAADMDTALSDIVYKTDPAFSQVDSLRASYGGDLVMLFRPLAPGSPRCGLASVGGFSTEGFFAADVEREYAYSHIGINCPFDLVVAHELGHNMGLTHSHREDGTGGTFDFSTGYGVDDQFATVMAYPGAFNTAVRAAVFSSPNAECFGYVCGLPEDDEFGADAVLSLNIVKYQVAEYFPTRIPVKPSQLVESSSGLPTDATIAMSASVNQGLTYTNTVSTTDETDIDVEIAVDSRHIGNAGEFYVLLTLDQSTVWQIDANGNISLWDGSIPGLTAFLEQPALQSLELINLVDDYRLDQILAGEQLQIFMAYQAMDSGEIIYTVEPLMLNVVAQ